MKKEAPQKSKFKRLKMRLRLRHWQAVGLLESLWQITALNAPDGDIGRLSNEDIAAELEWDDEPDELIGTLINCGWLDDDPQFRLIVHDWSDHVPTWLKGAYAKNGKQFADQIAKQRPQQPAKHIAKQPQEHPSLADTPNLTIPNLTQPNPSNTPGCAGSLPGDSLNGPADSGKKPRSKHSYSEEFERWYGIYPLKVGKDEAATALGRALKRICDTKSIEVDEALQWLCTVTEAFAESPKGKGEYVPNPATWLNRGSFNDDPAAWNRSGGSQQRNNQPPRVGPGQRYSEH